MALTKDERKADRSGRERSLYVHVPFCRHRCGYCNFSLVAGREYLIDRYLHAIQIEVDQLDVDQIKSDLHVSTVFLGGGTPSHLSPSQLQRLVSTLRSRFSWDANDVEFSIECNPEDFDEEKRDAFAELEINRISFGIQSFSDSKLKLLERGHNAWDIKRSTKLALSMTKNISFDLIFAVSDESWPNWKQDLQTAIELGPAHISTYELTIEKGTAFWNRHQQHQLVVPNEEQRLEMYLSTIEFLESAGYKHYEISSFARDDQQCKHNLAYWNGNDYYAIGPGAASYVDGIRRVNHRSTTTWLNRLEANQSPITITENLNPTEKAIDLMVFGLRQIGGISVKIIQNQTTIDLSEFGSEVLQQHARLGLADFDGDICRLTRKGITLYDSIAQDWINLV